MGSKRGEITDRDSDSSASKESLSLLLGAVRERLKACADRVDCLETEVKESSWAASGTAGLVSSGGLVELIEVELTDILVLCGREAGGHGVNSRAAALTEQGEDQIFEQGLAMAKRQVRELGDRVAKAKEQCM